MIRDVRNLLLRADASLLEAFRTIDAGAIRIALVVDENRSLLATVTDGDIRRGLLRGMTLDTPVRQVMHTSPHKLQVGYSREVAIELMRRLTIYHLPVVEADGRVVGIEVFEELVAPHDAGVWVVLMAGGLGTRLRPLTDELPKPMLPVGGRPLLETLVRNFEAQGFREIYLSVNYKAEVIHAHFADGLDFGVSIKYLVESERLGTAGALSLLSQRPPGPIIVMNGDVLTNINFRTLIEFHREQRAQATMCVREYSFQVPYGVVQTDGMHLTRISEKPMKSFFVNAGVYVVEPQVLDLLPKGEPCDMPNLFERVIGSDGTAAVFPIHEYWADIGRIDDLERAQDDFGRMFNVHKHRLERSGEN